MPKSVWCAMGLIMAFGLAPALAADPVPEPIGTGATDEDRIVCKKQEETGTRLRRRNICRTESAWRAQEESAKGFAKNLNRRSASQGDFEGPVPGS
jgi:hypothetical protein